MAKQGMKRPEHSHTHKRNAVTPVPEIQGKAKYGKERTLPIIANNLSPNQKVFHSGPFVSQYEEERPISNLYPAIDNDLARDNLENDISDADLQDL